jgi:post-segregation antitoxin (ccd killing protein)
LDIDEYAKKYGNQVVHEDVEVPAYLSTFAKEQRIDISATVNDVLAAKFQEAHA